MGWCDIDITPIELGWCDIISALLVIFIWIYSGFTSISPTLDNSNIGFNLPIIILFPIISTSILLLWLLLF